MPVLPGLLRDLVHSNDVTAHYGILLALYALMQFSLRTCAGRAVGFVFWAAAGLARLAGRRCCRLRHHGDGAFPLGSLYRADCGRHHRGDLGR